MSNGLKPVSRRRDDALVQVRWDRLEHLLAEHYRGEGFAVEHVGTGATSAKFDGGIDLKLRRGAQYVLVQVKHWNAYQVPHNDVHQLIGLMFNERASGAILVTSGEFTKAAVEAANRQGHVQLIDGDALRTMLGPLPETTPPAVSRAEEMAARIGERLLHTAIDRLAPATRRGATARVGMTAGWVMAHAITPLLIVAMAFFMLKIGIQSLAFGLDRSPGERPAAARVRPDAALHRTQAPSMALNATPLSAAQARNGRPCNEIIDHVSGTYVDRCARQTPSGAMTEAEANEARRRADEAIEILRSSTPEM